MRARSRAPALGSAALALAAALGGCAAEDPPQAAPRVWACPDALKVDPRGRIFETAVDARRYRERNAVFDAERARISLAGARGETLGFQLQVEAGREPLRSLALEIAPGWPAQSPIASFELFRAHYTEVLEPTRSPGPSLGPGWYPDALVPLALAGALGPPDVAPQRAQGFFVDVAIDRRAAPGRHRARVELRAAGARLASFELELEVYPFALPEQPSFRIQVATYEDGKGGHALRSGFAQRYALDSPEYFELERRFYRMARAHRHVLHPRGVAIPLARRGERLALDWRGFDARFGPLLSGAAFPDGVPLDYFELGSERNLPAPADASGPARERWLRELADYAREFRAHFRAMGWTRTRLVAFPVDEPNDEAGVALAEEQARVLRAADPELRFRLDIDKNLTRALLERAGSWVDLWAVQAAHFRGLLPELLRWRDAARPRAELWFYQATAPAIGPESLDAEALALRSWAWIGWRYGLDAADLWECCKWQLTPDIWSDPQNNPWPSNGAGVLYYPGAKVGFAGPIPSLRLKLLRRGAFDADYLALLAAAGGRERALAIAERVLGANLDRSGRRSGEPGEWSHDPDVWEDARRELARELVALQR